MTLHELKGRLPARTVGTLVVGALVALGFVAVFLLPEYRQAARLRLDLIELRADLDIQRRLAPVRASLQKSEAALPPADLRVTPGTLPLSEVGRLAEIVGELAKPSGVSVDAVSPDASSVGKSGRLAVTVRLHGEMEAMRTFLLSLCHFAPLVKVESGSTQMGRDGRELTLKCWLAVR
jgi:hypothetical protein